MAILHADKHREGERGREREREGEGAQHVGEVHGPERFFSCFSFVFYFHKSHPRHLAEHPLSDESLRAHVPHVVLTRMREAGGILVDGQDAVAAGAANGRACVWCSIGAGPAATVAEAERQSCLKDCRVA